MTSTSSASGRSGAWGDNRWGRTTQIYGVHVEYLWRQNGYESGGTLLPLAQRSDAAQLSTASAAICQVKHTRRTRKKAKKQHEEKPHGGSFDEFGIYSAIAYGLDNGLEFGLRGEFVEGIAAAGLDERFRVSPAVTYYFNRHRTRLPARAIQLRPLQ